MLSLSNWISGVISTSQSRLLKRQARAAEAWRRIQLNPTSIVMTTPKMVKLSAQTVKIESDNTATPSESTPGTAPLRKVVVYGVRDHATLPNTDISEKYTFVHGNDKYICTDIILVPGEIQGLFEATQ